MNKSFIFIALLCVTQVLAGGRGLNLANAQAFLVGGDCYVDPGVEAPVVRYVGIPYGWRQQQRRIVVPNVMQQTGNFIVGVQCQDGSYTYNDQIRFGIDLTKISVSTTTTTVPRILVIGNNYGSQGTTDNDYRSFVSTLPSAPVSNVQQIAATGGASPIPVFPGLIPTSPSRNFAVEVMTSQTPAFSQVSQVSDADRQRALERQYNANQALSQLSALIGTLSGSVSSTSASIGRLQDELDRARAASSQCNQKVLDFSGTKSATQTSIREINSQISQAQNRLNDYNNALSSLNQRKSELVQERSRIESKRSSASRITDLENRYNSCTQQAGNTRGEYSTLAASITRNSERIITLRNNAADAPRQVSLISQQISSVDNNIADLENQLTQARQRKSTLESDRARYQAAAQQSSNQIARLNGENSRLQGQVSGIQSRIDSQIVQCSSIKRQADTVRSEISSSQNDYDQINKQIQLQDSLISNKQNEINRFNSEIAGLPIRRSPLQATLTNTQSALDRQYAICSQSNDAVTNSQNSLQAANLKLESERRFLSDAQGKLPAAQQEKRDADDEVNRINSLASSSNIRSSSPVSVSIRIPVSVSIGDYMTRTYGSASQRFWQPFMSAGTQTIMYPISSTTWGALRGSSSAGVFLPRQISNLGARGVGSFSCGSGSTSGYGRITSIQPGYITLQGPAPSRESFNLRIGDCSRFEANRPEYVASLYDHVFFRGQPSGGEIYAHDVTCLS